MLKDGLWIVVDHLRGYGDYNCRLHWLADARGYSYTPQLGQLELTTEVGNFFITVLDREGRPLACDVQCGGEKPPRGWLARYYGEKTEVPSISVSQRDRMHLFFVSILSKEPPRWEASPMGWRVKAGNLAADFHLGERGLGEIRAGDD